MKTPTRRLLASVATLSLGLGGVLLVASPASAATLSVTSAADSGVGTLRDAITAANLSVGVADTITFNLPGNSTIAVATELPEITDDLTITGPGSDALTITGASSLVEGFFSFTCTSNFLTIAGLSIEGFAFAVDTDCLDVTIDDVSITGAGGSALYSVGGSTVITISTFNGNNSGALVGTNGTTTASIRNSSFDNNDNGGLSINAQGTGAVTISDVSTSDNSDNPGMQVEATNGAQVSIVDVTSSNNVDADGSNLGFGFDVRASADSSVTLTRVTAGGNSAYGLTSSIDASSLTVTDSAFDGNIEDNIAVVADNGSDIQFSNVTANDSTGGEGATFNITDSTFAVSGSEFNRNNGVDSGVGGGFTLAAAGSTVTFDSTEITDNFATDVAGGILVYSSNSAITFGSMTITGNSTDGAGGGILIASIEGTAASITITDSSISDNEATDIGGIYVGLVNAGTGGLTISNTTINGNSARDGIGGGIGFIGGIEANADPLLPAVTLLSSTFSNNSAAAGVAGGLYLGTSTAAVPGTLLVSNSTFSGNSATDQGGAAFLTGNAVTVRIANSTFSGNSAPEGGGIYAAAPDVTTQLEQSVFANNTGGDFGISDGTLTAAYSLIENPDAAAATAIAAGTGNLTGVDPKLGALANNGGTTRTMLPLAGSPLINAGNPAATGVPATDQRGLARISGTRIDIGAVEVQQVLAATGSSDPATPLLGGALLAFAGILLLVVRRRRTA